MWSLNHTHEPGIGTVHAAVLDSQNHIYAVGHTGASDNGAIRDIRVAKYDDEGTRQCEYVQSGPGSHHDSALGAAIAQDGGVYVIGFITDSDNGRRIWLEHPTAGRNAWLGRFCDGGCTLRPVPEAP